MYKILKKNNKVDNTGHGKSIMSLFSSFHFLRVAGIM